MNNQVSVNQAAGNVFRKLNLVQGTKEWLDVRRSKVTASKIPSILGLSDAYQTPLQVFEEMVNGVEEDISPFKQNLFDKGHSAEAVLREYIEREERTDFLPVVLVSNINQDLLASLDGFSEAHNEILEAKYVGAKHLSQIIEGTIKDAHWWQIQAQLLVSGADRCLYLAKDDQGNAAKLEITPDQDAFDTILTATEVFINHIRNGEPPEPSDRDFIDVDSYEGEQLAQVLAEITLLEAKEKILRSLVIDQAKKLHHKRIRMPGITITTSLKKGNIDYKKIPVLKGLDLEPYRGKTTEVVTIRQIKIKQQ